MDNSETLGIQGTVQTRYKNTENSKDEQYHAPE